MVLRLLALLYLMSGGLMETGPAGACADGIPAPAAAVDFPGLMLLPVDSSLAGPCGDAVMTAMDEPLGLVLGLAEAMECDTEDDGSTPALFLPAQKGSRSEEGMPAALGGRSLASTSLARWLPLRC